MLGAADQGSGCGVAGAVPDDSETLALEMLMDGGFEVTTGHVSSCLVQ